MYLHNIFRVHLHTVPGEGVKDLEEIFAHSSDYKRFRVAFIKHASYVENYIITKLEIIEKSKTFFYRKDLEKILRPLRSGAYLTEVQAHDIVSFAEGDVPRHEKEVVVVKDQKKNKDSEDFGHESTDKDDYERAAEESENDALAMQERLDAKIAKARRDADLLEQSKYI